MSEITLKHAAFKQMPRYRASPLDWIRSGGHAHCWAAFRFFTDLESYRSALAASSDSKQLSPTWLIPFRKSFRQLRNDETLAAIRTFLKSEKDLRPILIWLLSSFAQPCCLLGIDRYRHDPSPQVRKHVAKALRRLEAWTLLEEMARAYPDDAKIQHFASASTTHRPFVERLKSFGQHVDDSHAAEAAGPSTMPYWSRNDPWEGTPPKGVWYIRWILWRIHRWVHGG